MRSYDVARRQAAGEPVQFELTYTEVDDNVAVQHRKEVFTCNGEISSILLAEFARNAGMQVTDPRAMGLLAEFFVEAFGDEEEYKRFMRFRHKHRISDERVMEIVGDLMEDLSGRPTKPPSHSQGGQSRSGRTSKDGSLRVSGRKPKASSG